MWLDFVHRIVLRKLQCALARYFVLNSFLNEDPIVLPSVCSFVRPRLCCYLTSPWSEICSCLSVWFNLLPLSSVPFFEQYKYPSFLLDYFLRRQGNCYSQQIYSALGDNALKWLSPLLLGREGSITTLNTPSTFFTIIATSREQAMSEKWASSSWYSRFHQDTSALILKLPTATCSRVKEKDSFKACREKMFHF